MQTSKPMRLQPREPLSASFSQREIRSGWTAGAGIEVGFAPNWSAKLEYLYADFGNVRTTWLAPAVSCGAPVVTFRSTTPWDASLRAAL